MSGPARSGPGRDLTVAIYERRRRILWAVHIALLLGFAVLAVQVVRVVLHGGFA